MRIDSYAQLSLSGLTPAQAFAKIVEHVNELTDFIVQLNNEVEDLKRKQAELERQNLILQSQVRQ